MFKKTKIFKLKKKRDLVLKNSHPYIFPIYRRRPDIYKILLYYRSIPWSYLTKYVKLTLRLYLKHSVIYT